MIIYRVHANPNAIIYRYQEAVAEIFKPLTGVTKKNKELTASKLNCPAEINWGYFSSINILSSI